MTQILNRKYKKIKCKINLNLEYEDLNNTRKTYIFHINVRNFCIL